MIEKSRRFYTGTAVGAREPEGERQLKYHDQIDWSTKKSILCYETIQKW